MMALVEERIDTPVSIIDGYVTIILPHFSLRIVQAVKQVKGMGTHDAIRLEGQHPDPQHQAIIQLMLRFCDIKLTAEEIRIKTKSMLFFRHDVLYRKFEVQSHFQRKHSELLYWKVITKEGSKNGVPIYQILPKKALILRDGGVFT